jgi:hypothetical protein
MSASIDALTIEPAPALVQTDAIEREIEERQEKARRDFRTFRLLLNPNMLTNWWTTEVSEHLQQFYKDLIAGKRPKLALMAPPQHGKSKAVSDFVAWRAGVNPDLKVIFSSYSDELGARANVELQRAIRSEAFKGIFGRAVTGFDSWVCNQSLIEYADYRGSFRNVTIQGGVTGFALDLGIIDDYTKYRAEANSPGIRQKVWEWFVAQAPGCSPSATNVKHGRTASIWFKPIQLLLERKHEMSIGSPAAGQSRHPLPQGRGLSHRRGGQGRLRRSGHDPGIDRAAAPP